MAKVDKMWGVKDNWFSYPSSFTPQLCGTNTSENEKRVSEMKNLRFRPEKLRLGIFLLPFLLIGGGELLLLASNAGLQKETTAAQKKKRPNRLIREKSPYLLQHAYNPVDWFPWGDEAFKKARSENKLIFLSIGYSTCFWCHQMERDVFEQEELAE